MGGVHFLMEVDMDTALSKLQEQTMDTLRSELREKGIPYAAIRKLDTNGVEVRFRDNAARDQAISYMTPTSARSGAFCQRQQHPESNDDRRSPERST
ncbi:preprotein translocase subunit SecD [Serratia fonticola]|uniref:Preprotein translocase subunit SecD n=1 Tax=Serratia fonticola TaxID=47917 RepID=A0A4V6KQM8_SERFO|nr:preprotein translocase subunit SecD [Serratia fonticola]